MVFELSSMYGDRLDRISSYGAAEKNRHVRYTLEGKKNVTMHRIIHRREKLACNDNAYLSRSGVW